MVTINDEQKEQIIEAAEEFEKGLSKELQREEKVEKVLGKDLEEAKQAIDEGKNDLKDKSNDQRELEEILNDIRDIHGDIQTIVAAIQDSDTEKIVNMMDKDIRGQNLAEDFEQDVLSDIKDIEEDLGHIRRRINEEEEFESDEILEGLEEIAELENLMEIIPEIKKDLTEAKRIELSLKEAAEVIDNIDESKIKDEIMRDAEEEKTAEKLFEDIEGKEQELESKLEDTDELLIKTVNVEEEEIEEVQEDISADGKVHEQLNKIENILPDLNQLGSNSDHQEYINLLEFVEEAKTELENIGKHLNIIKGEMNGERKYEKQTVSKIESFQNNA